MGRTPMEGIEGYWAAVREFVDRRRHGPKGLPRAFLALPHQELRVSLPRSAMDHYNMSECLEGIQSTQYGIL